MPFSPRPLVALALLTPLSVHALQPLSEFVAAARHFNPANAQATAGLEAQQAQADVSLGRALPGLGARGTYTRNEYQVGPLGPLPPLLPTSIYIQRYNQLDAFFTINVPLIDLASFERIASARTGTDAAQEQVKATALQVEALVVQTYYSLVGNQALVSASERAVNVAKTNLQLTQTQFEAGKAAVLEVERAKAEVERQNQQRVAAELQVSLATRALQSATGITPDLSAGISFQDDLHEEPGLETFESPDDAIPSVAAAIINRIAAEEQARAAKFTLLPALGASLLEHGTNTTSFVPYPWTYAGAATLSWQLDYSTIGAIHAQQAALAGAQAREQQTRLDARDAIHRAWATVGAAIARGRSARAEQLASTHASQLAQDRYEAGAATQLDLLQAQRDAFSADVSRIQADADLANARLQLRIASGTDPLQPKGNL
jgi:outer membrane protein TolC